MSHSSLKDKVVIVTGGAKNLGGLVSRDFGAQGAKVIVHYHNQEAQKDAEKTVEAIKNSGGDAFGFQGDLTKVVEISRLFDAAIEKFGGVDITVNTVGKVLKKPISDISQKEYDDMFAVNSKSAYFFIQEAGKRLNQGGKIITVVTALLAAFTGFYSVYAGAKAPVEHLVY